jgi:programmed cell death protein 4
VVANLGGDIVEHAKLLLSRDHGGSKLEKIWGPGDGRPVEELKVAIDQLLQEFLLSGDTGEASRCIVELNSPLFSHEVVKRLVVNSLDKEEEKQLQMSQLLAHLVKFEIVSTEQAIKGFKRLIDSLPDLILDTPNAKNIVASFVKRAKADGALPLNFSE